MLASYVDKCTECGGEVFDLGDELVCRSCGVVSGKEVVETRGGGPVKAVDYSGQSLGGYMGPVEFGPRERFSKGLASSQSTFGYLKLVSDYAGREESTVYSCLKMIERVCEKLGLPRVVWSEAMVIARKLYSSRRGELGVNSAAVSAYSIITACKIERVTASCVKEIVEAHRLMGRRVRFSSLVKLSLESPIRSEARRAEDYVPRVMARLASDEGLATSLKDEGVSLGSYIARLREAALISLGAVEEHNRGGHSPIAIAATSVYAGEVLLSNLERRAMRITQRWLAGQAGVAEYTVREQYGEIFRPTLQEALLRATQIQRR